MTAKENFINPEADTAPLSNTQLENLIELQSSILGETVKSKSTDALLEQLCLFAEKLTPDAVASIMLLDASGEQLYVCAAPSIPEQAVAELNGLRAGDGSCGNAVFHDEDMYVCNTLRDARWDNVQGFANAYNIHACWSSPIHDENNLAIGSFALSSFCTRMPDNFQRRLLNSCASIAGIILQKDKAARAQLEHEKQLWESSRNLAVTVDSIADGVISTDIHGDIVLMNKVAEELTGWSRERAIGQHIDIVFNILTENDQEIFCDPADCIKDADKCFRGDKNIILQSATGKKRSISISEAPIKDKKGGIAGVVIAFRDVTQQQKNQVALLESQQRYRSILENTADALYIVNSKAEFIDVNQVACSNLGYSREELLALHVYDVETDFTQASFHELFDRLGHQDSMVVSGTHKRKDGTHFPVDVRLRKFLSNNESLIVVLASDITDRKKVEEEILRARKLESIGLLAGGIAHDFNNLLGIIMGNIELARRDLQSESKPERYLVKATNASKRASDLTQQLLTFSKGGEPVKKTSDITRIIQESTEFSLHGSSIEVNYQFDIDNPNTNVDSGQISQVIQNLVINARQAMIDGGQLSIRCEMAQYYDGPEQAEIQPGCYIKVSICDTGEGIPESHLDSIFDPYYTTKQEGSGLGLALSYSIIHKHNGYIFAESEFGQGSCFTILLPADNTTGIDDDVPAEDKAAVNGSARILVMDDDEMIREIGQAMLENLGYSVVLAKDGDQALTLYKQAMQDKEKIDLVIMDLTVLSGMGGKEAIKLIQQVDPDVQALVSSGYSNDPVMANFSDYGFAGAVSKPYTQDELGAAVSDILK